MNEGQPLAQTLATKMQLGVLGTSNTIAHEVRLGRQVADAMKEGGLVRHVPPRGNETLRMSAVSTLGKRAEAYAGYFYLAVGLRRDVTLCDGQVAYGMEDSVCDVDVLPYGDVRQRMGLKQYSMTYRLLNRMLREPDPPRLVVIDHTLL